MQGIPINWNVFTMINTIYAIANFVPMSLIAISVYRRDSDSRVNKLFSIAAGLMALAFLLFPVGGLLWYVEVLGIQVILISTRLVFLIGYASILLICWCSRVLYDGEAMWNRTRTVAFLGGFLLVGIIGVLTPDAIYIITGPPITDEIDTGEGLLYGLTSIPCAALILFISLATFWKIYSDSHEDDPILGRQALMLTIGNALSVIALVLGLLTTLLSEHALTVILFPVGTVAVIIMSFGFTRDASLLKLKITGGLRRMMVALARGRTAQAEAQLGYLKDLVAREQSDVSTVRMLILEGITRIYQSKLEPAKSTLQEARGLADSGNLTNLRKEIDSHLKHLKVHERAAMISESVQASVSHENGIDDLNRALAYLDEMISIRETDNESYA